MRPKRHYYACTGTVGNLLTVLGYLKQDGVLTQSATVYICGVELAEIQIETRQHPVTGEKTQHVYLIQGPSGSNLD